MSAPSAPAAIRTVTGGLLLRLLGLLVLTGLWLVLSAARAEAETGTELQLPTEPLSAPVSGIVETVPAALPEPLAPAVDQAADVVDGTVDHVTQPVQKPVERVVGTVDETTREVARQVEEPVRRGRDDLPHSTPPRAPAPPPADDPQPAPASPAEVAGSPVLPGDPRSSDAARHRSGGAVDRGATRVVAHAVGGTGPVPARAAHRVAEPGGALAAVRAQVPSPPGPLGPPTTLVAAATSVVGGASGAGQQLLVVAALAGAVVLARGASCRVAVPGRRRPPAVTLRPATAPD